ncbi:MAG: VanZ family protein [Deltaproteobacteria bacterium]|nr:VanZ family protein [Deltaproteobacteria bacterium]
MKHGFWLLILGCIVWLCGFVYLITYCPAYLPGNEHIVLSDFEARTQTASAAHVASLDSWMQSTHGVTRETGSGFSGSACIKLTAQEDKPAYIRLTLRNPRDYQFLQLRAKMRTEGVVRGAKSWNTARLLLYFNDTGGKINWDYPHAVGSLTGTSPWREFEKIFPVPEYAATATVVVQNSGASGILWCDDISLGPAYKNSNYVILRGMLFFAGIVLAIGAIGSFGLLKKGGWIPLAIIVMILIGVLCSQYYLEMIAGAVGLKIFWLKKTGHVFLFFLLGLASTVWAGARKKAPGRAALPLKQLACIFSVLLSFAALTELLQLATLDRGPGAFDFFINSAGIIGGIASACFFSYLRKGRIRGV